MIHVADRWILEGHGEVLVLHSEPRWRFYVSVSLWDLPSTELPAPVSPSLLALLDSLRDCAQQDSDYYRACDVWCFRNGLAAPTYAARRERLYVSP